MRADGRDADQRDRAPGHRRSSLVLVCALFPVLWIISLSFKTPTTIGRRQPQFLPRSWSLDNYDAHLQRQPTSPRALSQLVRHRADRHADRRSSLATLAAYAIAAAGLPGQDADPRRCALAIAMFPPISLVGPLFDMWRDARPLRHLARADHPVPDVHAAAGDLDAVGVLPRDPVGDGAGGPGRRRDAVAGVPQGDRAAGGAGRVHRRDPDLLLRLERLRASRSR